MREFPHPKPVSSPEFLDPTTQLPYQYTFKKYVATVLTMDPAWSAGQNDEAAVRMAQLIEFQDLVDSSNPGDALRLDDDLHSTVSRIARESKIGLGGLAGEYLNSKNVRFVHAIASARKMTAEEAKASQNGAAVKPAPSALEAAIASTQPGN
jgi:hypothetical protein